jgi:SAM-dependent methyltransferase
MTDSRRKRGGPAAPDQLQREAQFFSHAYQSGTRKRVSQFYRALEASNAHFGALLLRHCPGRTVLECGSGTGHHALLLAEQGARITGIDISPTAVEMATSRARTRGSSAVFFVRDVERTEFADNSFDLVCGAGILHHVDLSKTLAELVRVLRPGGRAIFREPMGHNPIINLFRMVTPHLRTKTEHPLTISDLAALQRGFCRSDCKFFHLSSLALAPFARWSGVSSLVRAVDRFDSLLLDRVPALRRFAWQAVLSLEGPRKS